MGSLNRPLISIIVPIYNSESYLNECIDSILGQTFCKFELILVNDGSTDASKKICDEYAKKDTRIITIHKENSGVSDARAKGFEISRGRYIGFIDSDDYIAPRMYEKLFNMIKECDGDIACCGYQIIGGNEKRNEEYKEASVVSLTMNDKRTSLWAHSDISANDYSGKIYIVLWNKLFKREILEQMHHKNKKNSFPFHYFNDTMVTPICLSLARKIVYTEDRLYYYRWREHSLSRTRFSLHKLELHKVKKYILTFYQELGFKNLYKFKLKDYGNQLIKTWIAVKSRNGDSEMQCILSDVWKEYKAVFPKLIFSAECRLVYKISFILFRLSPRIWRLLARLYPMTHIEGERL